MWTNEKASTYLRGQIFLFKGWIWHNSYCFPTTAEELQQFYHLKERKRWKNENVHTFQWKARGDKVLTSCPAVEVQILM